MHEKVEEEIKKKNDVKEVKVKEEPLIDKVDQAQIDKVAKSWYQDRI